MCIPGCPTLRIWPLTTLDVDVHNPLLHAHEVCVMVTQISVTDTHKTQYGRATMLRDRPTDAALGVDGCSQSTYMVAHNTQRGCPKPINVGVQCDIPGCALCVNVHAQSLVWSSIGCCFVDAQFHTWLPKASSVEAHFVGVQKSCGGLPKCVTSLGRPGDPRHT